jgi:hypothetical protein
MLKKNISIVPRTNSLRNFRIFLAAIALQTFYRKFIKCLRDSSGAPIDPIIGEAITDPRRIVRIIYQTYDQRHKIHSRLQIFEIESLWQSIVQGNRHVALNPLTNTRFTRDQFNRIVNQVALVGIIDKRCKQRYRLRYAASFRSPNFTSPYEVNEYSASRLEGSKLLDKLEELLITDCTNFIPLLMDNLNKWDNGNYNLNRLKSVLNYTNRASTVLTDGVDSVNTVDALYANLRKLLEKCPALQRISLLQLAIVLGQRDSVIALLECGVDIGDPASDYIFPIQLALWYKRFSLIEPLLLYGGSAQLTWVSVLGSACDLADQLIEQYPDIYQLLDWR